MYNIIISQLCVYSRRSAVTVGMWRKKISLIYFMFIIILISYVYIYFVAYYIIIYTAVLQQRVHIMRVRIYLCVYILYSIVKRLVMIIIVTERSYIISLGLRVYIILLYTYRYLPTCNIIMYTHIIILQNRYYYRCIF